MNHTIKLSVLILVLNMAFSCSEQKSNNQNATAVTPDAELTTIKGIVSSVTLGKDGYTAEVQTETDGIYAALVSIANVGGREKYQPSNIGDKVTFKGEPYVLGDTKQLKVTEIISITPTQTQLLIGPNSFRGIHVGDLISKHLEYIQKTKMRTGEGVFEVYEIKDFDNNPAGYFLPDPKEKLLVGDITVKSPKAQTIKGIKIGDTFQDLVKVFPDIEVHGSEIEGRTHASANNLSYRLDVANFNYEIDRAKIPRTAKITEITVNRGVTALILEGIKGHK